MHKHTTRSISVALCALILALTAGCEKPVENKPYPAPGSGKAITAFGFTLSANPTLRSDVAGTITGTDISVTVPAGTGLDSLIADFGTTGTAVSVNEIPQTSGVTANDFSEPVLYTVTAEDGSSANYAVTVSPYRISGMIPADGSATGGSSATLKWDSVETATGYEIQVASTPEGTSDATAEATAGNEIVPASPPAGSTWYWRVRAMREGEPITDWSAIASLSFNWGSFPVILSGPDNGQTTNDSSPRLGWQAKTGATSYEVQCAADAGALQTAEPVAVTDVFYESPVPFLNQTTYSWRVRAVATDALTGAPLYSAYSAVRTFTVSWGSEGPADGFRSAEELAAIGVTVPLSGTYALTADIDLTAYGNWTPIGNLAHPFTGTFEGNGHVIKGLTIESSGSYIGLFGCVGRGASIRDVTLTEVDVSGDWNVGGLIGDNLGEVSGCASSGTVSGKQNVGGLIGCNYGNITDCETVGTVSGTTGIASGNIGGLIGSSSSKTSSATNEVKIGDCFSGSTVVGTSCVGGLVGMVQGMGGYVTAISDCGSSGNVSGQVDAGGLVGRSYSYVRIERSFASGDVLGTEGTLTVNSYDISNGRTGGLIGCATRSASLDASALRVTDCHATGRVSGVTKVGGLVGSGHTNVAFSQATYGGIIERCYATGNVSGTGNEIGGLIGTDMRGPVIRCFSAGNVVGAGSVGGLIGSISGYSAATDSITDCYATGSASGDSDVGGLAGVISNVSVSSSYSIGSVTGSTRPGGFVGRKANTCAITACFYNAETAGQADDDGRGVPKYMTDMKTVSTFTDAGWDFAGETDNGSGDFWALDENWLVNGGYPYLVGVTPIE